MAEALAVLDLSENVSVLKLAFTNPLPQNLITKFLRRQSHVLIVEEIEPIIETEVQSIAHQNGFDIKIYGRLNSYIPREHELTPELIGNSIVTLLEIPNNLCAGCPHAASYYALKQARLLYGSMGVVTGDRGCYNQGTNPPLSAIDTCVCMGASISMASGLFHAGVVGPHVAVIGDSTFLHNGIQPLINAVHNEANITVMILDNGWTGMTGHQPNPNTGINAMGKKAPKVSIDEIVKACGVKHLTVVDPYNVDETINALLNAFNSNSTSVVISRQPCPVQEARIHRKNGEDTAKRRFLVDSDQCIGCLKCVNELGCPALDVKGGKIMINDSHCIGCGVCSIVCPMGAIKEMD